MKTRAKIPMLATLAALAATGFTGTVTRSTSTPFVASGTLDEPSEAPQPLAIDFEAVDLEGRPFHGIDLKGRIVLLDFWAVWCAPCLDAFPKLTALARDLEDEPFELVGLALYSGDHEDVRDFLTGYTADYTVVVGADDLAIRYDVIGYPTYLLIDPEGNIAKKYVGAVSGLEERVKADVRELEKKYGLDG